MRNRIIRIFNSTASEVAILVIVCCLIVITLTNEAYGKWNDAAVIAALLAGVVLVSLLLWATIMLITKKEVKEMAPKPRIVIENVSRLLWLYWAFLVFNPIVALIWAAFIIWDGVRSVRQTVW